MKNQFSYITIYFLIVLLAFQNTKIAAQFEILHHNPDGNEYSYNLELNNTGQLYACGTFHNTVVLGGFTLPGSGTSSNPNGFIGKMEIQTSTWLWARSFILVGDAEVELKDVALDAAGSIFITGHFRGEVMFDQIALSSYSSASGQWEDIFVAKLNPNGNVLWATRLGAKTGSDSGNGIWVDASGNSYVTGWKTSKINLQCSFYYEKRDIYVAKVNASGTKVWEKQFANSNNQINCGPGGQGYDITLDQAGNVIITGSFLGTYIFGGGPGLTISSTNEDPFAAKFNNGGTSLWARSGAGNYSDQGLSVFTDAANNVYCGGVFSKFNSAPNGSISFPPAQLIQTGDVDNAFLVKYNSQGNVLWAVNPYANTALNSGIDKILPASAGSLMIKDRKNGIRTIGEADGSVTSTFNLAGNENNSADPGAMGNFYLMDITGDGNNFISSFTGFCGHVDFGDANMTVMNCTECANCNVSVGDEFIVVGSLLPPPSIVDESIIDMRSGKETPSQTLFDVFPNPASNEIRICFDELKAEGVIQISDVAGKQIYEHSIIAGTSFEMINLDQRFTNGLYYITLHTKNQVNTKPLIISGK